MTTHPIPAAALDDRLAIIGASGSGKTVTAKGGAEALLRDRRHVLIIDPTGAWSGLRSNAAGDGPGFDIPIFGGARGDIPIRASDGRAIGNVIIEQRLSAVVDLSALHTGREQREFAAALIRTLRGKPKGNFHLVIDEADELAPETVADGAGDRLREDMIWIAKRGRVHGFVPMWVTQRPADMAKAVLSQAQTIVLHQLIIEHDRKAAEGWLKGNGQPEVIKQVMGSLAGLQVGERWVYSPRLGILDRGVSPALTTFDSSRTPAPGEIVAEPKMLAEMDLSALRAALAPAETIADTAEEIAGNDSAASALASRQAAEEITFLRARLEAVERQRDAFRDDVYRLLATIKRVEDALHEIPAEGGGVPGGDDGRQKEGTADHRATAQQVDPPASRRPQPARETKPQGVTAGETATDLPKGAAAIIAQIARAHPRAIALEQAAKLAGVSTKSSLWTRNRDGAKASGLIEARGDRWHLSAAGLGAYPANNDGLAPVAAWCAVLPPAAGRMLRALVDRGNAWTDRDTLADEAGISRTSSSLGGALAELRANGLAVNQGRHWAATDMVLT